MMRKFLGIGAVVGLIAGGAWTLATTVSADDNQHARPPVYQTVNVVAFATGMPVGGAGTVFRTRQSVDARIATSGLDLNAAYTVWWVVFNNPGACDAPCNEPDLFNPAVDASVFYAAGFISGADGTGNVTAHLDAGRLPSGIDVLPVGTGRGLRRGNGLRAEIHMVIRSHGPLVVGQVDEQIGSFNGACTTAVPPGPNVCVDQQAVPFPPVH